MKIDIYQIDAFTDTLFGGNPAAVCPLDKWPEDKILQQIASENNLAETAYFIKKPNGHYHLRWFTPELEMDLCGHATLASAFVIFNELDHKGNEIIFHTLSGELTVKKINEFYELDFPSRPPIKSDLPSIISESLNIQPIEVWKARDYLLVYKNENEIKNLKPNQGILNQINLDPGGIIVTSLGASEKTDFVSRFFTSQSTILEDPVTGSAHCTLIPFWSNILNKTEMTAKQLSQRGGDLYCQLDGDRVKIRGKAVKYMQGTIEL